MMFLRQFFSCFRAPGYSYRTNALCCAVAIALLSFGRQAVAADEFGDDDKPKPDENKPAAAAGKEPNADAEIARIMRDPNEDGLVRTVLESNPASTTECLRAIKILIDIQRPKVARLFVKRLIDTNPAPRDMDQLLERFGTATFLQLAAIPELGPEMAKFVDKLLKDATTYREDPQRLETMIKALRSNDERARQEAIVQLIRAHGAAVGPLLKVMADPARADEHSAARSMLVRLGGDAAGPLRGALRAPDPALKVQVIEALGRLGDRKPLLALLGWAVDPEGDPTLRVTAQAAIKAISKHSVSLPEAITLLHDSVTKQLNFVVVHSSESTPTAEIWRWDPDKQESVPTTVPVPVAIADETADLAQDLLALRPNDAATRRLCLTAILTAAALEQNFDAPLPTGPGTAHDFLIEQGAAALDDVLAGAVASGNDAAAAAAASMLGEIGTAQLLTESGERPSPLALAAQAADRRVRFAALDTILKLAPEVPFAGSGAIADDLGYFAGTSGVPRVLIGHPRTELAQSLAGLLAGLGYDVDTATNGRQTVARSIESPDYDFVLLHYSIEGSPIDETIRSLRRDPRTRLLPIGILVSVPETMKTAERLAASAPLTAAFASPISPKVLKYNVDTLLGMLGRNQVPFDVRQRQALSAVDWITDLSDKPKGSIYDLRPLVPAVYRAFWVPELQQPAALALANLGTVAGQRALVEAADQGSLAINSRQVAAIAFRRSVQMHGILLTQGEIARQYALYNNSERSAKAVQDVFSSLLDALERRDDDNVNAEPAEAERQ